MMSMNQYGKRYHILIVGKMGEIMENEGMKCPSCHKGKLYVPIGIFKRWIIKCSNCDIVFNERE